MKAIHYKVTWMFRIGRLSLLSGWVSQARKKSIFELGICTCCVHSSVPGLDSEKLVHMYVVCFPMLRCEPRRRLASHLTLLIGSLRLTLRRLPMRIYLGHPYLQYTSASYSSYSELVPHCTIFGLPKRWPRHWAGFRCHQAH